MDRGTVFGAAFAQVADGVAALRAAGSVGLDDDSLREAVRELDGVITQAQHTWLGLVAELDRRPEAVPGARAGAVARSYLAGGLNKSPGQARRDVAAARALDDGLADAGAAMAAGEVSREHVDVVVGCLRNVPRKLQDSVDEHGISGRERVDSFLTDHARSFDPRQLHRLGKHLVAVLDPDAEEKGFDPEAWHRRYVTLTETADGMTLIRGQLDAATAVWLRTALGHFAAPHRIDPEPSPDAQGTLPVDEPRDERSPGQRTADALATMARTAMEAAGAGTARREPPHVLVVATAEQLADAHTRPDAQARRRRFESRWSDEVRAVFDQLHRPEVVRQQTLSPDDPSSEYPAPDSNLARFDRAVGLAEIARAGPVAPDVLAMITCDALLQAVVLGESGEVLDLGRTRRTATRAQRRALTARDGGCIMPGCDVPASDCDSHHLTAWAAGGRTDIADLALLCPRHHTETHLGGIWTLVKLDGLPYAVPPGWHHLHDRPPRRGRQATREARRLGRQLRLDLDPPDTPAA